MVKCYTNVSYKSFKKEKAQLRLGFRCRSLWGPTGDLRSDKLYTELSCWFHLLPG